ncbi:MAG TPA: ATP12 family protein [Rhodoblastus sp.]|nr:ATP12 family protein [Rhodoblastus sp.]
MPDDFSSDFFIPASDRDPLRTVQKDMKRALPKRFYKEATVAPRDGGFAVLLDGRTVRTPAGGTLALPTQAAAALVAAEWAAQGETINPSTMPVTRLVNSALDGVARDLPGVTADIVKYAGSDLVCYRAGEPAGLVAMQARIWDPVLAFAREKLGARFILAEGVMFAAQPDHAMEAFAQAVEAIAQGPDAALKIAALHSLTTLTGSALIALMIAHGGLEADEAWAAAHVDEDWQMQLWGADEEALARRAQRFVDMKAAFDLWRALGA